ncbi:DUF2637 domain-containing protein [Nocardia sp. NPDC003482]
MSSADLGVRTVSTLEPPVRPQQSHGAHAFFWCVLAASAAISVIGNAVHAVLHTPVAPIAAAVAVVPPLALLTAVHGVTVLQRSRTRASAAQLLAITMTALIAGGAFWLSFTALRALAELAGIPHHQAWLWPLIIEGSMAQATVALIALARPHDTVGAPPDTVPAAPRPLTSVPPSPPLVSNDNGTGIPDEQGPRWSDLAQLICRRDPSRRRDPDTVTRILVMHFVEHRTPTDIAQRTGRSRSTVSRIISLATRLDTTETTAQGSPPIGEVDDATDLPPRDFDHEPVSNTVTAQSPKRVGVLRVANTE